MVAVIITLVFATVFLGSFAFTRGVDEALHSPAAALKRRLKRMSTADEKSPMGAMTSEWIRNKAPSGNYAQKIPAFKTVNRLVEHSGVDITTSRLLVISGLAAMTGFLVTMMASRNGLAAFVVLFLLGSVSFLYLAYRREQRMKLFDEQFPDALTMLSRSLRAGHALPAAVELVSQEMPEPTGGLFKVAYDHQLLGMRMSEALRVMMDRIESMDLRFFITIIMINSESGGNLAEIMDKLSMTIRERIQIRRQVKALTAEGRLSGYVLLLLPAILFIAFNILNHEYMNVFFTERICQFALLSALIMQFVGFLVIRKIVNIRI